VLVVTLLRTLACLRSLRASEVTDPALIAIAQMSVELDGVRFPVNKRSTQKEPRHWSDELYRQGLSQTILAHLQYNVTEAVQATLRAKKAVSCLYYLAGTSMEDIERAMAQFGGAVDGTAGPIRSVASRTCDVLSVVARAADVVHAGVDLKQRLPRLLLRLELGIRGPAVELARYTERRLDRADYQRLCDAKMTEREALAGAEDDTLLPLLGNDAGKVRVVRDALERWRASRTAAAPAPPLPQYEG
jgi:helicase